MYTQSLPKHCYTTTMVAIKYDCCEIERQMKWVDANKNFIKNNGKHICRTCLLKNNNPACKHEVREKMKKTCMEKYGTACALNTERNTQKRVEQMFGTEEAVQKIVAKRKKTSIKKYGVDHIMKTEEGRKRQSETMQKKYGVDHALQNPESLAKMRATVKARHGVDNVAQLDSVQEKIAATNLERYGVEHYNQLPEMKDYLREHCPGWLGESWANPWAKGITRPQEWNDKARETIARLMELGTWKSGYPRSKKGFCYPTKKCKKAEVYFRSSYEAIYCYHLDNNEDVDWFTFEGFRIEYPYKGSNHFYIPDFLIQWKNKTFSIHELKAEFLKEDERVLIKTEYAKLFAENNNMEFTMLCCKEIVDLGIQFEYLKETGFVKTET
jgi:hypothetical protein